ncbi:MAG: class 1 fructose-bisphosphatase [Hyphomicrobiaceae bacterium]
MLESSAIKTGASLDEALAREAAGHPLSADLRCAIAALARAGAKISHAIRAYDASHGHAGGEAAVNADGDTQLGLDVIANEIVLAEISATPTAYFASEEEDAVVSLDPAGTLAVAVDPLDGSSNVNANITIGTIFSVFAAVPGQATASFLRPGREQIAAGYLAYGPHTALVLTLGKGTHSFVLDDSSQSFRLAARDLAIPATTREFAINASNYRHWHPPVRAFIDDCLAGAEGPRGKEFNMRWVASLVAETHRIMMRGGAFLYPADARKGYESGRLRHVYEAAPIAFVVEQAGGRASDGHGPILDNVPAALHVRTPLIFGSAEKVGRIESYHQDPGFARERSPLFRSRGLFNA